MTLGLKVHNHETTSRVLTELLVSSQRAVHRGECGLALTMAETVVAYLSIADEAKTQYPWLWDKSLTLQAELVVLNQTVA